MAIRSPRIERRNPVRNPYFDNQGIDQLSGRHLIKINQVLQRGLLVDRRNNGTFDDPAVFTGPLSHPANYGPPSE